jgi:hypothetical protein
MGNAALAVDEAVNLSPGTPLVPSTLTILMSPLAGAARHGVSAVER